MKVAITGASGVVGTVLRKGLRREFELRLLDLPKADVRDYETVLHGLRGMRAVIHLAWNTRDDNYLGGPGDPGNTSMAENVYRAAVEARVLRVVVASSVHADDFLSCPPGALMSVARVPAPATAYGARKVAIEALGCDYSDRHGLEAVCLWLGGVAARDRRPRDPSVARVWLHHADLVSLVRRCLLAPAPLSPRFQVINAVSANPGRVHDTTNALGWTPGAP